MTRHIRALLTGASVAGCFASCATTQSALPMREIANTIALHREHYQNCYDRAFRNRKGERPEVTLQLGFEIGDFGRVKNTHVVQTDVPNALLERCLQSVIAAAVFPAPEPNHHFEVSYPFRFKPKR